MNWVRVVGLAGVVRMSLGVGRFWRGVARGKGWLKSRWKGTSLARGSWLVRVVRSPSGDWRISAGRAGFWAQRWTAREAPMPVP